MTFRAISARRPTNSATVHNLWAADCLGFCAHTASFTSAKSAKSFRFTQNRLHRKGASITLARLAEATRTVVSLYRFRPALPPPTKLSLSRSQGFAGLTLAGAQGDGGGILTSAEAREVI
jgi:hypothetical protein